MRKLSIFFMLMSALSMLLFSSASADIIRPLESAINPEHLENTASYARILGYNEENNTLTAELIVPETFYPDDVEALKAGDGIFTNGNEVLIETIESAQWGFFYINETDESDFSLVMNEDGNYRTKRYGDYIWNTLAVIECPVTDALLFLDYIDDQSGNPLELPVVHTAQELTARFLEEEANEVYTVGLMCNNAYVVFDGNGQLAAIHRFYVPWQ